MPLKKPTELEAGMILASDVTNLDGQILFKKGVELVERQIEILQMWGVPNVEIEGDDEDEELVNLDVFPPHILEKAERLTAIRFKLVKSAHPVVETIKKFCVRRDARGLMQEERSN